MRQRGWALLILLLAAMEITSASKDAPAEPSSPEKHDGIKFEIKTWVALLAAALACALSMSAGVGGGGVLVPIFNIILGVGIKESTGLSQAVIASSGIGSAVFCFTHAHPHHPDRPLVDLSLALVLTPALLLGITVGVLANAVFPSWIITLVIIGVLSYMAQRTFGVARRMRSAEKQAAAMQVLPWSTPEGSDTEDRQNQLESSSGNGGAAAAEGEEEEDGRDHVGNGNNGGVALNGTDLVHSDAFTSAGAMRAAERAAACRSRPSIPWRQVGQVAALWAAFAGLQLVKSRLGRCTWPYLILDAIEVGLALCSTLYFVKEALAADSGEEDEESANGHETRAAEEPLLREETRHAHPYSTPLSWSRRRLNGAAASAVVAGAIAGLIGMGGGFLLNPLLLEFGLHPQVCAATSSLMVLFSSSAAALTFIADGRLDFGYVALFGSVCCVSAFSGVYLLARVVKKRGASVVIFVLAIVISLGAVATAAFDGVHVWHQFASGQLPGFHEFCQPAPHNVTLL